LRIFKGSNLIEPQITIYGYNQIPLFLLAWWDFMLSQCN
jgi:hypothetical protein